MQYKSGKQREGIKLEQAYYYLIYKKGMYNSKHFDGQPCIFQNQCILILAQEDISTSVIIYTRFHITKTVE